MRTIIVSRHPGAIQWLEREGFHDVEALAHLKLGDIAGLKLGDVVVGVLPVGLAARVCEMGANFFALEMDIPVYLRGEELSVKQMDACNARVQQYLVKAVD